MDIHTRRPLPIHRREAIEGEIEALLGRVETLIARLDRIDPDPDLEDDDCHEDDDPDTSVEDTPGGFDPEEDLCLAGDHGGGFVAIGPHSGWGAREDDEGVLRPVYGLDQTKGPINNVEANKEYQAKEMGLERSPTGGWRFAGRA